MPENRQVQKNATHNHSDNTIEEAFWRLKINGNQEGGGAVQSGPYPDRPGEPDCLYYLRTGLCGYGSNCRYHHPAYVSQGAPYGVELPERVGQPDCGYFLKTGTCKYGSTCKYHHPRDRRGAGPVSFNILGLPMRQEEKPCPYYMRTVSCKFGGACKFHHPQPESLGTLLPVAGHGAFGSMASAVVPSPGQPYAGGLPAWSFPRVSYISSPRLPGPESYMPVVLPPPGIVSAQGWNTYMGPTLTKMAAFSPRKNLLTLVLIGIFLAGAVPGYVKGQDCSACAADECCSKYNYCGKGDDYCGVGCKQGPCNGPNDVSVPDIVTEDFFNGILNQATGQCPGKSFYTRAAFINALGSYEQFGRVGSADDSKREIAAFFAHATHETGSFCYIEESDVPATQNYCNDVDYPQYPCNPSKRYYGRGPLQLTWNYNYAQAGSNNGFDGLNSPETVATDAVVSFKVAMWYWMNSVQQYVSQGFGATIKAINGDVECNGKEPAKVQSRIDKYTQYCQQFGVAPGENLSC